MLGRWVSDLEVGDLLGPVEQVITPFLLREYAHAVEDLSERYHGGDVDTRPFRPPSSTPTRPGSWTTPAPKAPVRQPGFI